MVLTISDYSSGKTTVIIDFPVESSAEAFVSEFYGVDNVEWMLYPSINLEIVELEQLWKKHKMI